MGTKLDMVKDTPDPSGRQVVANEVKRNGELKAHDRRHRNIVKRRHQYQEIFKKLAKALKQKYEGLKAMNDHEESVHLATQSVNEKQTGAEIYNSSSSFVIGSFYCNHFSIT